MTRRACSAIATCFAFVCILVSFGEAQAPIYVMVHNGNAIAVIDNTNTVVNVIPIASPTTAAISQDGGRLYVLNNPQAINPQAPGASSMSVVDPVTGNVLQTVPLGNNTNPDIVNETPDGNSLYVGFLTGGAIGKIDISATPINNNYLVLPMNPYNPYDVVPSPDGSVYYATVMTGSTQGDLLVKFSASGNSFLGDVTLPSGIQNVALSPDGSTAYVTNGRGPQLSVVSTSNMQVVQTVSVGPYGSGGIAVSPDGSRIIVASEANGPGNGTIYVIDAATLQVLTTASAGNFPVWVTYNSDGSRIYVTNEFDGTVWVYDANTYQPIAQINVGANPLGIHTLRSFQVNANLVGSTVAGPVTIPSGSFFSSGTVTVMPVSMSQVGSLPSGYSLAVGSVAWDISTTASYSTPLFLCFNVPSVTDQTVFDSIRIFHYVNGVPSDATVLSQPYPPNFATHTICAYANSLSPFVLATQGGSGGGGGSGTPTTMNVNTQSTTYGTSESVGVNVYTSSPSTMQVSGTVTVTVDNQAPVSGFLSNGFSNVSLPNSLAAGNHTVTVSFTAQNGFGGSSQTTSFTVSPASLYASADSMSRIYGSANPQFTGSLSGVQNGDAINLSFSTTATQSSPVGTYTITPSVNGDSSVLSNYSVTVTPGTLTVTPAPLSAVANSASRSYGSANPAFTGSLTGIVNGDLLSVTFSTGATAASPVGKYAIVPTIVDPNSRLGNYSVSITNGVLSVTPAPLVITANSYTKILDAANPALSATYSGFVLSDGPGNLNGSLTCSTTATTNSPVGKYPINCSGQSSTNYAISYAAGTLTIIYAPSGTCLGSPSHVILPPIDAAGYSVFNQGRTVPAQFRVCDASGVSVGTGVVTSFNLTGIVSGTLSTVNENVASTTPDTSFRYDANNQVWIFNISTAALSAGNTYVYTIVLSDGSTINFQFGLR